MDVEINTSQIVKSVLENEAQFKTTAVSKPLDVDLDIGSLLAIDTNLVDEKCLRKTTKSNYLCDLNRDNVQILLNKIWELPTERVEDAIVAALPSPVIEIPREKPLPKPKQETKWEAYAKLKGIQKKKKERMVWDETHKEYRPAWGYKRANDETKEWMIEVPDNADPFEDQYEKRKTAKKERVAKNEYQRLKNLAKNNKGVTSGDGLTPSAKQSKDQVNLALTVAKASTASAGKFTKALPKEHEVKKPKGKKRKFESNTGSLSDEKTRQLNVLNSLSSKQPKLNTNIAVKQNRKEELEKRRTDNSTGKAASRALARKQAAILSGKKQGNKNNKRRKGKR
ncbi:ribosome biogenesis regulatory protein homolog isoform X2 [Watersipora subatra]|uniref:ribosome biogenesis regulatory protein homolog isoform X2 n=1 Tax=Watersipora subatra TaxID=2589382 RepID=UPI00355B0E00